VRNKKICIYLVKFLVTTPPPPPKCKILSLHNNNYCNLDHMKVTGTNVTVEMKKADYKNL
jgi:hypothetical protein